MKSKILKLTVVLAILASFLINVSVVSATYSTPDTMGGIAENYTSTISNSSRTAVAWGNSALYSGYLYQVEIYVSSNQSGGKVATLSNANSHFTARDWVDLPALTTGYNLIDIESINNGVGLDVVTGDSIGIYGITVDIKTSSPSGFTYLYNHNIFDGNAHATTYGEDGCIDSGLTDDWGDIAVKGYITQYATLTYQDETNVEPTSVTLNGTLTDRAVGADGGTMSVQYGTTTNYELGTLGIGTMTGDEPVEFQREIQGLTANTLYYFRWVYSLYGYTYGSQHTFTTSTNQSNYEAPTIDDIDTINIDQFGFDMTCDITDLGTAEAVGVKFDWGLNTNYDINPQGYIEPAVYITGTGTVTVRAKLTGENLLAPDTTYHWKVTAIGDISTVSEDQQVNTLEETELYGVTKEATNIQNNQADISGVVYSAGEYDGVYGYFDYGTTTSYGKTIAPSQPVAVGSLTYGGDNMWTYPPTTITGLEEDETYHYRLVLVPAIYHEARDVLWIHYDAYWTYDYPNLVNCEDQQFNTGEGGYSVTSVNFYDMSDWAEISDTKAFLNGNLTEFPGGNNVAVGFQYGTVTGNLTSSSSSVYLGGSGKYKIQITGLTQNTKYYWRAVVYSEVPQYGEELDFYTKTTSAKPTALPTTVPDVTQVDTLGFEYITNLSGYDGGAIKLRASLKNVGRDNTGLGALVGFDWGTDTDYGGREFIKNMNSVGVYELIIQHLVPDTTYHFRAIAIGNGMVFGSDKTFQLTSVPTPTAPGGGIGTRPIPPIVLTLAVSYIGDNGVQFNGELTSMGNATLVLTGFEYGITESCEYGMVGAGNATGNTEFDVTVDNLKSNTKYYYRAVAVGTAKTSGELKDFTTTGSGNNGGSSGSGAGDRPGILKTINDYLGEKGWGNQTGHWIIVILLMVLAVICCQVFIKQEAAKKVCTIIFPIMMFGLALVSGWLNAWVAIGLTIIVAFLITGIILRQRANN